MFKKSIVLAISALTLTIIFFLFNSSEEEKKIVVAVTQIAPHPSLDRIRTGITDVLKEAGIQEDQIIYQNAQGNPATALQIAQKFVSLKPQVIVPITTPSAQAALTAAKASNVPVIFSAVSDPLSAKLVDESLTSDISAGVSDLSPVQEQVQLLKDLFGANIDVGILYNVGETNSVTLVDQFEKAALDLGMRIHKATASSTNNVGSATQSLIAKGVRAIYIPNDNTVISALESVLHATTITKTPIITADPESVQRGALASIAHDQYEIGRETGRMILEFLKEGKPLKQLGVRTPKETVLSLNLDLARQSNITIPEGLAKKAKFLVKSSNNS